jgi:Cu/Ag efflux protein CusF
MKRILALTAAALFALSLPALAAKEGKHNAARGTVKSVDADKHTITVDVRAKGKETKEETFTVGKDVKLSDIKAGQRVELQLSKDKTVEKIEVAAKKR